MLGRLRYALKRESPLRQSDDDICHQQSDDVGYPNKRTAGVGAYHGCRRAILVPLPELQRSLSRGRSRHPAVTRDHQTCRPPQRLGSDPMIKRFIFAFALTTLVTPTFAYTCEDVRRFVAENGLAQARAKARAAGMTDAQERQAAACLGIRIGRTGRVYRTGYVYRTGHVYRSKRY
jgi:hypothetical protein